MHGTDTSSAFANLLLTTGNFGRAGTGGYPMRGHNNVHDAFSRLDSLVVQDIFVSRTAQFADVVLPAWPSVEKEGTFVDTERRIQRFYEVMPPLGDSRPTGRY